MPPPETAFAWHAASPTTRTLSAYVRRGKPSRSEEHTSELQSLRHLVCRLLLDRSTTDSSTLSLHDALPICDIDGASARRSRPPPGLRSRSAPRSSNR